MQLFGQKARPSPGAPTPRLKPFGGRCGSWCVRSPRLPRASSCANATCRARSARTLFQGQDEKAQ